MSADFIHPKVADPCYGELPALVSRGFQLFDERQYFEAHEVLETAWRNEKGAIRNFYRGILQVAVGYYHIQRGNYRGARKMFVRCRPWLAPFPPNCLGIDLIQFHHDFEAVENQVALLGPDHLDRFDTSLLKPLPYIRQGRDSPTQP